MADVLGVGVTHFPGLKYGDSSMANILRQILERPEVPAQLRDRCNWPEPMRMEWGEDEGLASARRHRERLVQAFRQVRAAIDRFAPDFLLIWGDDQYENFQEDIVPPFCVYLFEELVTRPFLRGSAITRGRALVDSVPNVWNEPADKAWKTTIHREGGEHLVAHLIEAGFDVSYAYRPLHCEGLSHAFMNTLLYLDYDRKGFNVPIVPFVVNCYGKDLLTAGKGLTGLLARGTAGPGANAPPGPAPRRCFEVGAAVRKILEASPWRAVVVGSSSWSHAFLTPRNGWLYPDIETDRKRYEELKAGRHTDWKHLSSDEIEAAGEHEFRNWICLVGAMADRRARVLAYEETHIFNSDKCVAIFE